jgi:hypothetical protein
VKKSRNKLNGDMDYEQSGADILSVTRRESVAITYSLKKAPGVASRPIVTLRFRFHHRG